MQLYPLSAKAQMLEEELLEAGGEITPEIEALMSEVMDAGKPAVEQAGFILRSLDSKLAIIEERLECLKANRDKIKAGKQRIKDAMLPLLSALGGKVKTPEFTVSTSTRHDVKYQLAQGAEFLDLDPVFYRMKDPELVISELDKAYKAGALPEAVIAEETETTSVRLTLPRTKKEAAEAA